MNTKGEAQEPAAEPAAEPTAEPAQEPATEPAQEPAAEPAQEQEADPAEVEVTIKDLLAADLGDDEVWEGGHKGIDWKQTLNDLGPNARKLMANMRKSYGAGMAELAQLKRELRAEREKRAADQRALLESPAMKKLAEAAAADPTAQEGFDLWTNEGQTALTQHRVAEAMRQMFEPLQQQFQVEQYRRELQDFKREHPDMVEDAELNARIKEVVTASRERAKQTGGQPVGLREAYWQAKGQVLSAREAARKEKAAAERAKARNALSSSSTGRRRGGGKDARRPGDAWAAFQRARARMEGGGD